jgi:hypothetical protein
VREGAAHSYKINKIKALYILMTIIDGIWENT